MLMQCHNRNLSNLASDGNVIKKDERKDELTSRHNPKRVQWLHIHKIFQFCLASSKDKKYWSQLLQSPQVTLI